MAEKWEMDPKAFTKLRFLVGLWRHLGEKGQMGPRTSKVKGFHRVSEALEVPEPPKLRFFIGVWRLWRPTYV